MSEKKYVSIYRKRILFLLVFLCFAGHVLAQQQYELNSGWKCIRASSVNKKGEQISNPSFLLSNWIPAIVPGTVLTSLLFNKLIPDPFYGMNNKQIPDIYDSGRAFYTYWFAKDFAWATPIAGEKVWLLFRGVNYSYEVYLNGHKVNVAADSGMYLRHTFDITSFLAPDRYNRLAVIVYPPDPVGNPNGGQGGDGTIAHSITSQYVAGWDWIQPVHDRNTGIWDKVFIKKTKQVCVNNTHVVTEVPGARDPDGIQNPAIIKVSTEVENFGKEVVEGVLQCELEGKTHSVKVRLRPHESRIIEFPAIILDSPKLWWPNGYGPQNLYDLHVKFLLNNKVVSDEEQVSFGVRELNAVWNTKTKSREVQVNGQKIFIKGGNRIVSDAMLRFSKERYDAELRYHRDMNLNLIRVWGGGITERPEFYDACDKYGLLVMQDFWVSGDCNGRWDDPLKLEDTFARRNYPDDHELFLESLEDQVKMLRNHPSLAIWCGGNEIRPPADILVPFRDSLLPRLDGTRFFFEYSNDDSMSFQSGDGPYTLQPDSSFWTTPSFPFNSEVGSVGIGDYESLLRFIPKENLVPPYFDKALGKWVVDSVWRYHKYIGYDSAIEPYRHARDARDFAFKAQLVNYNQYRALVEGFSAHMWDWYTGVIIWKTQNPWTAMLGQMYDVYLDPNACLYGVQEGSKPLHVMYDPVQKSVMIVNNAFKAAGGLHLTATAYDFNGDNGNKKALIDSYITASAGKSATCAHLGKTLDSFSKDAGAFLDLTLTDSVTNQLLDENLYWLPDGNGNYSGLQNMRQASLVADQKVIGPGVMEVTLRNPAGGQFAFFIRVSLISSKTRGRKLPAFCNNNYISVPPGQQRVMRIEYTPEDGEYLDAVLEGWNLGYRPVIQFRKR